MKARADLLLVEQGLFSSHTAAQRAILAGEVRVGPDHVVRNASEQWPAETEFTVTGQPAYVSRGAGKLDPMLTKHAATLEGAVALDLGASTGGFTDLLLQRGAAKVYAVDVGHGQLHWNLRNDDRVVCLERTNARYLTAKLVPEHPTVLTADLSFISLRKVLPAADRVLGVPALCFLLIKPQFEAGSAEVGKGGVVRSAEVRQRVVMEITEFATLELGWLHIETAASPVLGPKGNQEYIGCFSKDAPLPGN